MCSTEHAMLTRTHFSIHNECCRSRWIYTKSIYHICYNSILLRIQFRTHWYEVYCAYLLLSTGSWELLCVLKLHFSCEFYLLAHYSPIWPIQRFESWFINKLIFNMILKHNSSFYIHYSITREFLISELKAIATPN